MAVREANQHGGGGWCGLLAGLFGFRIGSLGLVSIGGDLQPSVQSQFSMMLRTWLFTVWGEM